MSDPGRLLSDTELDAHEALIRAAVRWTKPETNKVGPAIDLIFAELRRLRARVVEVTTFSDERRRLLCQTCGQTFDGGPVKDPMSE